MRYQLHIKSNMIPWREAFVEVVQIREDKYGQIDMQDLEEKLIQYKDRPMKIGTFSACSNVTGILTDTDSIAALLHKHNALAFFDYATAGTSFHFTCLCSTHTQHFNPLSIVLIV